MIPREILSRLSQLRQRERMLRLVWGLACFVSTVALVVLVGCLIDYTWDRWQETPTMVHVALLGLTGLAAVFGALVWIILPQSEKLHDDSLALMVEEKHPTFRNRLISAVQLNRAGAVKQGMSEELIGVMTMEAEKQSKEVSFPHVTDHGRVGRAVYYLVPVALVCLGLLLWQPKLGGILLGRHFMADLDIPRNTHIDFADHDLVKPAGETVALDFKVTGTGFNDDSVGSVYVTPEGQPRDRYPLKFKKKDAEGNAIFGTEMAPSTLSVKYAAELGDGRTKKSATVKIVQRPVVVEQTAFTVLPAFCGVTSKGARYEVTQPRGDVVGILGSDVKVEAKLQKPIKSCVVEVLAPEKVDNKATEDVPEKVVRTVPCTLQDEYGDEGKVKIKSNKVTCQFPLKSNETGYRIVATDEYGFKNVPPPRRNLRVVAEEPPTVMLLKDYFTPGKVGVKESLEDFYIDGLPIPINGVLRVPFLAEGPYGLGKAYLLIRVLKKAESGNEIGPEEPWNRLELIEVNDDGSSGPFDPRRGVFALTPETKGIDFVVESSDNPNRLGRTLGGGRPHFKTGGIADGKGGSIKLREGDKIEYCIEVHADKGTTPGRPIAKSESKIQEVGSLGKLVEVVDQIGQQERRLRELYTIQQRNFRD